LHRGGNFGVVTSFEYRLHPIQEVQGGPMVFPLGAAPTALRAWADLLEEAPDDFGGILGMALLPPFPFVPEEWHGKPGCIALVCWTGPPSEVDDVVAPLRAAEPLGVGVGPMPYPVMNTLFDELLPPGLQHYWKANFLDELSDEAIAVHVEHAARWPTPEAGTFLFPMGGAASRGGSGDTAYVHRDARFNVALAEIWRDPADSEDNIAMVREYAEALRPFSRENGDVNFMAADDGGRVRQNYGLNHDRLAAIKGRYDPDNLFRLNHNIAPAPDAR